MTTFNLNDTVTFTGVNAYMGFENTFTGQVIRRNKKSLTVQCAGGLCTVPYEFIVSPK
jgi:hypothetical protein